MDSSLPLLTEQQVRAWIEAQIPLDDFRLRKVLLIVPDATRTAPLPLLFGTLYRKLKPVAAGLDVLVALGTHPAMPQAHIEKMLGIAPGERGSTYAGLEIFNHEWDRAERLTRLGVLTEEETAGISDGLLREEVPVTINTRIRDYDVLLVVGPVFPHEVVGFSGGNKYFFPGISGPELLNFFHWLGAIITNVGVIGRKHTPVRAVVDRAAAMIPNQRRCLAFVVGENAGLYALFYGAPEEAWSQAADVSARVHIKYVEKPFQQVLSCTRPCTTNCGWRANACISSNRWWPTAAS